MLTHRQEQILRAIVREYEATGVGVPSEAVAARSGVKASPATIRHEMACLAEDGYIRRPHISAGGVPSEEGFRYYVGVLMEPEDPSREEQVLLRHLFHQAEREVESWVRLAAVVLARMVNNLAVVTAPKAQASRLRHLDLLRLQDFLALLVLVLEGARLRRQQLALEEAVSQEDLHIIANRLNALWSGLTAAEIEQLGVSLSPVEARVGQAVVGCLKAEDQQAFESPYLEGWRQMLGQPEFGRRERLAQVLEFLEEREALRELFREAPPEGVRVLIGSENRREAMLECGVVLARYGLPGEREGALGVIGPVRMPYQRTVSMVRYLSSLMSDLVQGTPL